MMAPPLGLYAYPWDVLDEGQSRVLDAVERAGLNTLYIATWYHSGMFFLPHSPKRRVYFPTPGALYFRPGSWHDIHALAPPVSDLCEDWSGFWKGLSSAAKRRGIALTAWMPVLHNSGVGSAYPDIAVENPWGDRIFHTLCPSNHQVSDLAGRIAADIAGFGIFDRILLESIEYLPLRHDHHHEVIGVALGADIEFLASLCFCESCRHRLNDTGVDGDAVRDWVRRTVDRAAERGPATPLTWDELEAGAGGRFGDYLRVRESSVSHAARSIVAAIRETRPDIRIAALDFGPLYPLGPNGRRWQNGVDLDESLSCFDELHPTYYFTDPDILARQIASYDALLPDGFCQVPAIRAILPQTDSAASLEDQLDAIAPTANGYTFYNYSFMRLDTLDWIRAAIRRSPPQRSEGAR